jgi:putative transposase
MPAPVHHRKNIRLKDYDYSLPGGYFVTINTIERGNFLGEVVQENMMLNKYGTIVQETWNDLIHHVKNIELDIFTVMPNHVHGIIIILDSPVRAGSEPALTKQHVGLPEIVRQFKTFSARRLNECRSVEHGSVWQRNYYEHIIRNDKELEHIRKYIYYNPSQWKVDEDEQPPSLYP